MGSSKAGAIIVTIFVAVLIIAGVVCVDYYKDNQNADNSIAVGETDKDDADKAVTSDGDMTTVVPVLNGTDTVENTKTVVSSFAGQLKVTGTKLTDQDGNTVVLRGISSHGLSWYPQYVNEDSVRFMHDGWGMNVIRLAMYTAENGGYCVGDDENKKELISVVERGVDAAIDNNMYVIIDWHILSDANPNTYVDQAAVFFDKMSEEYSDVPNVIYEICNEPNGATSWDDIKEYADRIIPIIRSHSPEAVVIVGTPQWSQKVDDAAEAPLKYDNVMYALHFYAGTHKEWLRTTAQKAIKRGLPIFVSEFGITDASGSQGVDVTEGGKWLDFMNENELSACMWSLSNKNEAAAIIIPDCEKTTGWTYEELKKQGQWMLDEFMGF